MTLLLFNVAACVLPLNSLLLPRLLVQLEERAFMFFQNCVVPTLIKITFLFVYKRTAVEIQFYFVSKQSCNIFFVISFSVFLILPRNCREKKKIL